MKKIIALSMTLVVLFAFTGTADALTSKYIYRTNGVSAMADWFTEGDIMVETVINVFKSKVGTEIMYFHCEGDPNAEYVCQDGMTTTDQNVFTVNKKLTTASLAPVEFEVWTYTCDEITCEQSGPDMVIVKADWAGTGQLVKGKFMYKDHFGNFMSKFSAGTSMREASATGKVGDTELGLSTYGSIEQFRSMEMFMEK